MSSSVVWNIVKRDSCFLKKRDHAEFTSEPGNLTANNAKKYSGLANEKTITLKFDEKLMAEPKAMRKVNLIKSAPKNGAFPKKATSSYKLARGFRGNVNALQKQTARFRPDLQKAALARWTAMNMSLRARKQTKRARNGKRASK
jgi:large subunit ribosomal protein L28e